MAMFLKEDIGVTTMRKYVTRIGTDGILSCVLIIAAGGVGLSAQQAVSPAAETAAPLSPPYKTITYSAARPQGATEPFFSHGCLIQFLHKSTFAGQSNIYLWNSSGLLEHEVAVWPAKATSLFLTSVDVGISSQLTFAGEATNADGTTTPFIATSNLDGESPKYFSTGNYRASQIAQADDGTIWTVGAENFVAIVNSMKKWNNYDVLRHYSPAGALLDHFLPRWGSATAYVIQEVNAANNTTLRAYDSQNHTIATYAAPFWGPQGGFAGSAISSQSWLKAVSGGVVLYDGRSGIVYRYSSSNPSLSEQGVELSDNAGRQISGFTVTSDGRIFASMQSSDATHPAGFGLFQLSSSTQGLAKWSKLPQDASGMVSFGLLLGSDGTAVVYQTAKSQVNWSEVSQ